MKRLTMISKTNEQMNVSAAQALANTLVAAHGYLKARVLPDASVACLVQLLFTKAIIWGCQHTGWNNRFCFKDQALAVQPFNELQSEVYVPQCVIARR